MFTSVLPMGFSWLAYAYQNLTSNYAQGIHFFLDHLESLNESKILIID